MPSAARLRNRRASLRFPAPCAALAVAGVCAAALGGCGGSGSANAGTTAGSTKGAGARQHRVHARPSVAVAYRPLYDLPAPLQDPASAPLGPNRFVLLGGLDAADTSSDGVLVGSLHAARQVASLPNAQHDAQAAALGGRAYVFGGGQFSQYDHILSFDPASGSVASAGVLPAAASDVAVASSGSTAYVVGGFDGVNWLNTIVAWSPGASARVVGRLPTALRYAAAAAVGNAVVIAGGSTPAGTASDAILRFDPATGAVRQIGRLPVGVSHAGAGVIGGTVYVVGGRGASLSDRFSTVWAIDPASGRVRRAGALPQPLSDMGVVSLGGRLVVAGGASAAGTVAGVGEFAQRPA